MAALMFRTSPHWQQLTDEGDGPAIVLLHGYGSHEDDLAGLAPLLPPDLPWASVRAPMEMGFGGAAWFPLQPPTLSYSAASVESATADLWRWVDTHVPDGMPLLPLGFSQGGLMALQMLRTRPERIAGTIVLSGFVADVPGPADERLRESTPPVLWCRGDADAVIPAAEISRMQRWLPRHAQATTHVHRGLGHGIDERVMADVVAFIDDLRATSVH